MSKKVSLYNPDPKRNNLITGTVVGSGWIRDEHVFLVELDSCFQGYVHYGKIDEQYISTIVVHHNSVTLAER